ncbi:MAG TPA: hypothetical protein PL078_02705 [Bacillota bacterium]|nr:hypothetical protein [Peptococcaceae bacterium MAG4]NLW38404.1 hypothetical protein [Peptococcaceae bacterium]HPZ42891.1 hypothetical protein [Bacillota bacterium]HQD75416.1 hypothetical protein [Bacillota bacterium]HUM58167.1 hypothetical protein [Bacillota bacterium]
MEYISNASEVVYALQGNLAAQIQWLKSCQILKYRSSADGVITRYPHQGWVTPYFSNFAAMALLEEPAAFPLVRRYLNWYLRNENNGTILDYHYDQRDQPTTSRPDSEDAYAGTFLSLTALYHQRTGHTGWVRENLSGLKKIAQAIVNLMDRDGLTYALASHRVKYLMDNCEAYRGLEDFSNLLDCLGDEEAPYYRAKARAISAGIERMLWNPRIQLYHPSKTGWFRPGVNIRKFYPDASCQIFPVLCGLHKPESERGAHLYKIFNKYHPDWVKISPPDYPWMILGYYACLHGDYRAAYEKVRYVREVYIDSQSSYWFCAEAAFFVLTCSCLLQKRDLWLRSGGTT